MTVIDAGLRRLRLDEIESFVVVAEELHFGRAAVRLYVSAGALSRRIAHLERALGTPLLERTTRSVALTPYGRRFVVTARAALGALATARD